MEFLGNTNSYNTMGTASSQPEDDTPAFAFATLADIDLINASTLQGPLDLDLANWSDKGFYTCSAWMTTGPCSQFFLDKRDFASHLLNHLDADSQDGSNVSTCPWARCRLSSRENARPMELDLLARHILMEHVELQSDQQVEAEMQRRAKRLDTLKSRFGSQSTSYFNQGAQDAFLAQQPAVSSTFQRAEVQENVFGAAFTNDNSETGALADNDFDRLYKEFATTLEPHSPQPALPAAITENNLGGDLLANAAMAQQLLEATYPELFTDEQTAIAPVNADDNPYQYAALETPFDFGVYDELAINTAAQQPETVHPLATQFPATQPPLAHPAVAHPPVAQPQPAANVPVKRRIAAPGNGKIKCTFAGCDKVYTSKQTLEAHERTHTGERIPCGWPGCRRMFPDPSNRRRHRQAVHADARKKHPDDFRCKHCGKITNGSRPDNARRHEKKCGGKGHSE